MIQLLIPQWSKISDRLFLPLPGWGSLLGQDSKEQTIFLTNWLKFRGCHLQWISTSKTISLGIVDMKISWNWKNTCHIFIRAHHDEVWMISDLHYDHKANAESATALLEGNVMDGISVKRDWYDCLKAITELKYPPDGFNVQQTRWPKLISEWFLILKTYLFSIFPWGMIWPCDINFQLFLCLRMAGGVKH